MSVRKNLHQAGLALDDGASLHADPRGYHVAKAEAEAAYAAARAAFYAANPCRYCDQPALPQAHHCADCADLAEIEARDMHAAMYSKADCIRQLGRDERRMQTI